MTKICPKCGNTVYDDDVFCGNCGARLEAAAPAAAPSPAAPPAPVPAVSAEPAAAEERAGSKAPLICGIVAALAAAGVVLFAWPGVLRDKKPDTVKPGTSAAESAVPEGTGAAEQSSLPAGTDAPAQTSAPEETDAPDLTTAPAETEAAQTEQNSPASGPGFNADLVIDNYVEMTAPCVSYPGEFSEGDIYVTEPQHTDIPDDVVESLLEAGLDLTGYEVVALGTGGSFIDDNAGWFGVSICPAQTYEADPKGYADSAERFTVTAEGDTLEFEKHTVTAPGGQVTVYRFINDDMDMFDQDEYGLILANTWTFAVPKGFGGLMVGYAEGSEFKWIDPGEHHLYRID